MTTHAIEEMQTRSHVSARNQGDGGGHLTMMWRRKWLVLLCVALSAAAGVGYIALAVPMYRSTSRIYVQQKGPKIIQLEEGVMTQSNNYLHTQVELVKSTPILTGAIGSPGIRNLRSLSEAANPLAYLSRNMTVKVGKRDEIINISVDAPYADDAARLTNAVVDSYVAYHSKHKQNTASEVLKILQKEKQSREEYCAAKLKAMLDFKQVHNAILLEDETGRSVLAENLARLSHELTSVKLKTMDAKAAYESLKAIASDPVKVGQFAEARRGPVMSDETVRARNELRDLKLQMLEWVTVCTEEAPAVQILREKIAALEEYLVTRDADLVSAELMVARREYDTAMQREGEMRKYLDLERERAVNLSAQLAQYTVLRGDWDQAKKLVDILWERIREINVTDEARALNISVLETAYAASKPAKPHRPRVMAIAIVLGLVLGIGLCVLMEGARTRLRTSEEVSAVLGAPVVGVVPEMSRRRRGIVAPGRVALEAPSSPVSEAYRNIRTAVSFCGPDGLVRTVLVTSVLSGDGKSTVVSNLAITMAQAGQRTLIIDADFRRPSQHRIFQVPGEDGISSVLAGKVRPEEAIRATGVDNLDILACGTTPENPSELLQSKAFGEILRRVSQSYDCVVVDSPPVTPVTDARILGALCDATLLVLRADTATPKSAGQARDGLLSVGANILGSVVNAVSARDGRYGYWGLYYNHRWESCNNCVPSSSGNKESREATAVGASR